MSFILDNNEAKPNGIQKSNLNIQAYPNDKTSNTNQLNSSTTQQFILNDQSINYDLKSDIDDSSKNIGNNTSMINNSTIHENLDNIGKMEMDDIILKKILDDSNRKNGISSNLQQTSYIINGSMQNNSTSHLSTLQTSYKHLQESHITNINANVTQTVEIPNIYKNSQLISTAHLSSNNIHNSSNQSPNLHHIKDNYDNRNSSFQYKKRILNENNNHNNSQKVVENQQHSNSDLRYMDHIKSTNYQDIQNSSINGNNSSSKNLNSSMNLSKKLANGHNYTEQFSKEYSF